MRRIQKQIVSRRRPDVGAPAPVDAAPRRAPSGSHEHPEEMWIELPGAVPLGLRAGRALRSLPNVTKVEVRRIGRWLVATGCELDVDDVRAALEPLGVDVKSWFLFNVGGYDERPRGERDD